MKTWLFMWEMRLRHPIKKTVVFPNMKDRKNVAPPGSDRSGVMVLRLR